MSNKIVFLLPSLAHGGAQKVFLELVGYLTKQGANVSLLCLEQEGELLDRVGSTLNVTYLSSPSSRESVFFRRARQWYKLRRWISKNKVDTVFSTITGMNLFTLTSLYFKKDIKIIIREACSLENINSRFVLIAIKLLYCRANKIICTSNYVKEQLISITNCPVNLEMIPNPVDFTRIQRLSNIPLQRKLPEFDGYTLISVGRLVYQKGFDVLVSALGILGSRLKCRLLIIGEGAERSNLESLIKELGLHKQVILMGYNENPYAYMSCSDLFVLSSRWEGYVNTLIEAMALDLPVVATDCNSEPGNILRDELGQELVEPDDALLLADAIEINLLAGCKPDYKKVLARHNMEFAGKQYMECCIEH